MRIVKVLWDSLISLLVDDGFLAIAALVAIAATWLSTRAGWMGPVNAAGWTLFVLLAASVVVSSRRAVKRHQGAG